MTEPLGPPPLQGPVKWHNITYTDAKTVWDSLVPWVHWLVREFAIPAKIIPPCWHAHAPIIEELTAIWTAYEVSYDPTSPGSAAPGWLRELEWTKGRIRAVVATSGCTVREHRPDRIEDWMDTQEYAEGLTASKRAEFAALAHGEALRAQAVLERANNEWG